LYGRGASDNKGPIIGALYAMKAVMESGRKMKRKVRIIFGTDEESGWEDMEYYFKKEPMPDFGVSPDADYPLSMLKRVLQHLSLRKNLLPMIALQ
jgi:succinyl-diaminopimelate desuccinylase